MRNYSKGLKGSAFFSKRTVFILILLIFLFVTISGTCIYADEEKSQTESSVSLDYKRETVYFVAAAVFVAVGVSLAFVIIINKRANKKIKPMKREHK